MRALYLGLGAVILYCLVQSIRFRMAAWQQRASSPDMMHAATGVALDNEELMKEAFLTEAGREHRFKHRTYDAVGILAAGTLILLWLGETGLLERFLERM